MAVRDWSARLLVVSGEAAVPHCVGLGGCGEGGRGRVRGRGGFCIKGL